MSEQKPIKKYCRGCGNRLKEGDGAFWKFDFRCVVCRIRGLFSRFGLVYQGR